MTDNDEQLTKWILMHLYLLKNKCSLNDEMCLNKEDPLHEYYINLTIDFIKKMDAIDK